MRWIYAAFWIIVCLGIAWKAMSYNRHLDQAIVAAGPQQQHFFFIHGQTNTATQDAPPKPDGADVQQVGFSYTMYSPSRQYVTCHVTLLNKGNRKATDVQILVYPYRGIILNADNDNHTDGHALLADNPLSQINQWVAFPDLDPGQMMTKDAVFLNTTTETPGDDPYPQIIFHTAKPAPASPAAH